MSDTYFFDSQQNFQGGMQGGFDAGHVADDQYAKGVNVVCRDGVISSRPAIKEMLLDYSLLPKITELAQAVTDQTAATNAVTIAKAALTNHEAIFTAALAAVNAARTGVDLTKDELLQLLSYHQANYTLPTLAYKPEVHSIDSHPDDNYDGGWTSWKLGDTAGSDSPFVEGTTIPDRPKFGALYPHKYDLFSNIRFNTLTDLSQCPNGFWKELVIKQKFIIYDLVYGWIDDIGSHEKPTGESLGGGISREERITQWFDINRGKPETIEKYSKEFNVDHLIKPKWTGQRLLGNMDGTEPLQENTTVNVPVDSGLRDWVRNGRYQFSHNNRNYSYDKDKAEMYPFGIFGLSDSNRKVFMGINWTPKNGAQIGILLLRLLRMGETQGIISNSYHNTSTTNILTQAMVDDIKTCITGEYALIDVLTMQQNNFITNYGTSQHDIKWTKQNIFGMPEKLNVGSTTADATHNGTNYPRMLLPYDMSSILSLLNIVGEFINKCDYTMETEYVLFTSPKDRGLRITDGNNMYGSYNTINADNVTNLFQVTPTTVTGQTTGFTANVVNYNYSVTVSNRFTPGGAQPNTSFETYYPNELRLSGSNGNLDINEQFKTQNNEIVKLQKDYYYDDSNNTYVEYPRDYFAAGIDYKTPFAKMIDTIKSLYAYNQYFVTNYNNQYVYNAITGNFNIEFGNIATNGNAELNTTYNDGIGNTIPTHWAHFPYVHNDPITSYSTVAYEGQRSIKISGRNSHTDGALYLLRTTAGTSRLPDAYGLHANLAASKKFDTDSAVNIVNNNTQYNFKGKVKLPDDAVIHLGGATDDISASVGLRLRIDLIGIDSTTTTVTNGWHNGGKPKVLQQAYTGGTTLHAKKGIWSDFDVNFTIPHVNTYTENNVSYTHDIYALRISGMSTQAYTGGNAAAFAANYQDFLIDNLEISKIPIERGISSQSGYTYEDFLNKEIELNKQIIQSEIGLITANTEVDESFEAKRVFNYGHYQGCIIYKTANVTYIAIVMSGHIFLVDINTGAIKLLTNKNTKLNSHVDQVYMVQAENYLIIQDGIGNPKIINGTEIRKSNYNFDDTPKEKNIEVPKGTNMAYGQGRLCVQINEKSIVIGDIFLAYDLENILKFTETKILNEGGGFTVSGKLGNIVSLQFANVADTSTGDGPLLAICENGFTTFAINNPRNQWSNIAIQKVQMLGTTIAGKDAFVNINEDIIYRSPEGIRSYAVGRSEANSGFRFSNISTEVSEYINNDNNYDLKYASLAHADNRMLALTNAKTIKTEVEGYADAKIAEKAALNTLNSAIDTHVANYGAADANALGNNAFWQQWLATVVNQFDTGYNFNPANVIPIMKSFIEDGKQSSPTQSENTAARPNNSYFKTTDTLPYKNAMIYLNNLDSDDKQQDISNEFTMLWYLYYNGSRTKKTALVEYANAFEDAGFYLNVEGSDNYLGEHGLEFVINKGTTNVYGHAKTDLIQHGGYIRLTGNISVAADTTTTFTTHADQSADYAVGDHIQFVETGLQPQPLNQGQKVLTVGNNTFTADINGADAVSATTHSVLAETVLGGQTPTGISNITVSGTYPNQKMYITYAAAHGLNVGDVIVITGGNAQVGANVKNIPFKVNALGDANNANTTTIVTINIQQSYGTFTNGTINASDGATSKLNAYVEIVNSSKGRLVANSFNTVLLRYNKTTGFLNVQINPHNTLNHQAGTKHMSSHVKTFEANGLTLKPTNALNLSTPLNFNLFNSRQNREDGSFYGTLFGFYYWKSDQSFPYNGTNFKRQFENVKNSANQEIITKFNTTDGSKIYNQRDTSLSPAVVALSNNIDNFEQQNMIDAYFSQPDYLNYYILIYPSGNIETNVDAWKQAYNISSYISFDVYTTQFVDLIPKMKAYIDATQARLNLERNTVIWRGLISYDFSLAGYTKSTRSSSSARLKTGSYDGIWTGINAYKLLSFSDKGIKRTFIVGKAKGSHVFAINNGLEGNWLYPGGLVAIETDYHPTTLAPTAISEITTDVDKKDLMLTAITKPNTEHIFETRSMAYKAENTYIDAPFIFKHLDECTFWVDDIKDDVELQIFVKTDALDSFTQIGTLTLKASTESETDPTQVGAPQSRAMITLKDFIEQYDSTTNVPIRNGNEFQFRFKWTGNMRIRRFLTSARKISQPKNVNTEINKIAYPVDTFNEFDYNSL